MLKTFINMVSVVSEDATVTEAALHATDGLITIDGVTGEGKDFRLTYREEKGQAHADP